ncbi:probable hydrolase [Rhodococcus jostii RHA1]|uniref:Probable hydrolase n=1 Tax=Rhodococcus jostii (strain RHA1) TaxID=101510 RepID=Q0S0Z4_RHOJR|nr:probable hydrolase [Rhodococcus jostii RHA1]
MFGHPKSIDVTVHTRRGPICPVAFGCPFGPWRPAAGNRFGFESTAQRDSRWHHQCRQDQPAIRGVGVSDHHQRPDGFAVYTGNLFAPHEC